MLSAMEFCLTVISFCVFILFYMFYFIELDPVYKKTSALIRGLMMLGVYVVITLLDR